MLMSLTSSSNFRLAAGTRNVGHPIHEEPIRIPSSGSGTHGSTRNTEPNEAVEPTSMAGGSL